MKFTLAWLKTHLATEAGLAEVTAKLTAIGHEVESVVDRAKDLAPFVVGHVVEARPHPDADRLRVCVVDTGRERIQVVCGAPNARAGMKGVFAPVGATIPGTGLLLKAGTIRGQASNGMLCSAREMGLSDEHDGIIELPEGAPIGAAFAKVAGLDDPVIDLSITPNRGDCLGVRGLARDLAAAGLGRLVARGFAPVAGRFASPIGVCLDTLGEAGQACPMFVGRLIRGVSNRASPKWLQDHLLAVGLRPISALVDITNFFTLDVGRPLHVFDADTIAGSISVRLARPGESLRALNGKDYVLEGAECVIADDDSALALGGVMGGEPSGCTERTRNVFVECALFDPVRTAATGRRHQILSDARFRFERGVDPAALVAEMEAATHLIQELCGGEASEIVIAGRAPEWRRTIALRPARVAALGGVEVPAEESARILRDLGCEVAADGEGRLSVVPPSWRGDIHGEADLVEEVVRIHGFEHVKALALPRVSDLPAPALTPAQRRAREARRALAGMGMMEAVTFSFMTGKHAALFGANPDLVLANPISAELDAMRPSILPNLLRAAQRNADRGLGDVALFEVGPVYLDDTPTGQSMHASAIRVGATGPRHWAAKPRAIDAYDAKDDALALLAALGAPVEALQVAAEAPAWYHPGRSGVLKLGPKPIGAFGEIHPRVLVGLDVDGPAVGFEIVMDALPPAKARAKTAFRPPALLAVERDFAFVVDAAVSAEAVLRAVRGADKALIVAASVFDVYQGAGVPEGKKSLAVAVRLQPGEKTLTDAEIEGIGQRIVAAVAKSTGATLRG